MSRLSLKHKDNILILHKQTKYYLKSCVFTPLVNEHRRSNTSRIIYEEDYKGKPKVPKSRKDSKECRAYQRQSSRIVVG